MAKKIYILKTVGITLKGYKREDLKVGMSVNVEEKVGDAYAKKGLLVKADAVAPKSNADDLAKANEQLTKELEGVKSELAESQKANEDLTKANEKLAKDLEAAKK